MAMRTKGFTLIELMIAMVIAGITGVVVLTVLMNYQQRKQTVVGTNDASINASVGMYTIEREARMAGAGYVSAVGMRCTQGANVAYNDVALLDSEQLMPLEIIDGAAGAPDRINIIRSDADFGLAPSTVMAAMASATAAIIVDSNAGFANGDLILAVSNDSSQPCTVMQLTAAPAASGANWSLAHASTSLYNPADPPGTFTTDAIYQPRDGIVNLGSIGLRTFEVVCSDGAAPAASNNCDLKQYDPLALGAAATMANTESIVSQVVDLQAQYGVAPAGSQIVNQWVDATGAWTGALSAANVARIKAVRVSIVTRGNREGTDVGPASVTLWDATTRDFAGDELKHRYEVLTVVIPLINVIWAGV